MLKLLKSLRRRRNECKTVADMPFAEIKQCSGMVEDTTTKNMALIRNRRGG